ncbi:656_t:CDS:2 [Scutellospora calospora]|uniref:656_t:CDS:1 n=1 Tax=Scutellospora calospora TaxID=85575 RepID=A0ACA9L6Y7_9GLOM|nr:656_t:CDS:2 [Scutellospora calospora]
MPKANTLKNRYYKPTSSEIDEIIRSIIPKNTCRATSKWVKILENWCHDVGYDYGIEIITDKNQLECEMTEFILGIRQINTNKKNLNALVISVLPDSEDLQGPNSWYLDERLDDKTCRSFIKTLYSTVGINIGDRDIVNYSGQSTPITFLFQKGVPMGTTMSITRHKSELSYQIYARPSDKQHEDALSLLIDSVGTLPSNSQEESINTNISFSQDNSLQSEVEIEMDAIPTKHKNSFEPMSLISPTLIKLFHQPLQTSSKTNYSMYVNALKRNPTISRQQILYKNSYENSNSTSYEDSASGTVVKNYYINAQTVNIS